jgi:PKD repeat protein
MCYTSNLRCFFLLIFSLTLLFTGRISAAESLDIPLLVTYGSQASTAEGDHDYREVIFLRVPDAIEEPLYLRIFDPEVGGEHDLIYGSKPDTRSRFSLYGGSGAAGGTVEAPEPISNEELAAGELLADAVFGEDAFLDNRWHTFAKVTADQGDHVGTSRVFRLVVSGLEGNDANLFSVALSLRDRRTLEPAGLEVFTYAPTVRIPDNKHQTELTFTVPDTSDTLIIRNFDAAGGSVQFVSSLRSVALPASMQDEWREGEVTILPDERGKPAAVVLSGGTEIPNDVTVTVSDRDGEAIPIRLPAKAWVQNKRPIPKPEVALLANCGSIAFDASQSADPDTDALTYLWEFGDGTMSTDVSGVHRYDAPGRYKGRLLVTDSSGQVGNGSVSLFDIDVRRPPTADAGPDMVVAPGTEVVFDGSASQPGDRPITRYLWNYQGDNVGTGAAATHVFAEPGRYNITLQVEEADLGACSTAADRSVVVVNAPPLADSGPDRRVAVDEVVSFDAANSYDTDGRITAYTWDFGDGAKATGQKASHAFIAPGTYTVSLAVEDDAAVANSTTVDTAEVIVNASPVAMGGPDRHVAIGEVIDFDASGSFDPDGILVDHAWNFGDGSTGTGSRVPFAYGQPGIFLVTLTVRDNSNLSGDTATDRVDVYVNAPPIADAGEDQLVTSSEVNFDGTRSRDPDGEIADYSWEFGDGTSGTGPNASHVFKQPGVYDVQLTVTDNAGVRNSTATDHVQVTVNSLPIADAGPNQLGAPGQVLAFDASRSIDPDGDVQDTIWDFMDGQKAAGERVTHAFERPGIYNVRLRVSDNTGQSEAIDHDEARVVINAPPAANAGPDILSAPGEDVTLDASNSFDSDGNVSLFRWDLSDANEPFFGATLVRAYSEPGVYGARLTITDDSGAVNATAQDEVTIRINHQPVANAGTDVFSSTSTITFDGSQSADADGNPLSYKWDFGDGSLPQSGVQVTHTYAEGGRYPVVLSVDDGTGLANATNRTSVNVVIDRPPTADAGGNKHVCSGDIVVFDGTNSKDPEGGLLRYTWDFGDKTSADVANPTKVYTEAGMYPVELSVEDESGFVANRHTDRVVIRVEMAPLADAGPDQTVCAGQEVRFDGSKSRDRDGVVNRYSWKFSDSVIGGGEKPVHVFNDPGDYPVALTIEGDQAGQCANTATDEMIVHVVQAPIVEIDAPAEVPLGDEVVFDASSSTTTMGRIVTWTWDFGDGQNAVGPIAKHHYDEAGAYIVTLTIETEGGISTCNVASLQHSIVVNAPPVAVVNVPQRVGVEQEVMFDASASYDPDGTITAYQWSFGDGSTASGVYARHRFRESGAFPVTLTVFDDTNLPNKSAFETVEVRVNHPPEPVVVAPAVACPGETLTLTGDGSTDLDSDIVNYSWSFGDGTTADQPNVQHTYSAPGVYDLQLAVDDGAGLNNSRQQRTILFPVNQSPSAEAGPDRHVCAEDPVVFDASASADWDGELVSYLWDFGDGVRKQGQRVEHRFTAPGAFDVTLTISDDSDSACAAAVDVARVTVNSAPIAKAAGDREGFVGGAHDHLNFDASASNDPDGQLLSYLWEFEDGGHQLGETVTHRFAKPGTYNVRLTVDDGSGLSCGRASDEILIAVRKRE